MKSHEKNGKNPSNLTAVRLGVAGLGTLALALGIAQGGYQDTLGKAVRICLECIGIG